MAVAQSEASLAEQLYDSYVGTRKDLEISRHVFFGEISYIVRDPITFDGHNLTPADYEIFTNLTDEKPLGEICQELIDRKIFPVEETESFYRYVVELQKRSLLSLPVTDSEMLYRQFEQKQRAKSKGLLMKLLFVRLPLGSPDRFLGLTYHMAKMFFTKAFFVVWLMGLLTSLTLIAANWNAFTSDLSSALAIQNLPTMIIVMAVLKLWHELGHGYACKHYGVSVPNSGILFMLGTPLAFMDATGSWSLPNRWHRQAINMAGIYFELMISIVAAFVWVFVSNPMVSSIAHFALVISSITTIAFNVNPLMKYDGYFVLSDLIGIPNLKSRAAFTVQNLSKHLFFKLPMPRCDSPGLQSILIVYGIAASIYKISLTIGIALMISMQIWLVGMAIGTYYFLTSFGGMLKNLAKYLIWSKEIEDQRRLAYGYLGLIAVFIPCVAFTCPIPGRAQAQGVLRPEKLSVIHAEHGGFVRQIASQSGQIVEAGERICDLENIEISNEKAVQRARLKGLLAQYRKERNEDLMAASITSEEISQARFELVSMQRESTQINSPIDGVVLNREDDRLKLGQYIDAGEELASVGGGGWLVSAVANSESLADIRPKVGQVVHCRFVSASNRTISGKIKSVSASGNQVVPYRALTHLAGGFIPVDGESLEATEPFSFPDMKFTMNV